MTTELIMYLPLESISAQLTDPKTGLIYTFTAVPPGAEELADILSVPAAEFALDMTPKEFVQIQCWKALRIPKIEQLRIADVSGLEAIRQLLPLLTAGINILVEKPTVEGDQVISRYGFSCSQLTDYSGPGDDGQLPSEELAEKIALLVSRSPITKAFIQDYVGYVSADPLPQKVSVDNSTDLPAVVENNLFANSKTVISSQSLTIPKIVADGVGSFVREIRVQLPGQANSVLQRSKDHYGKLRINRGKEKLNGTLEEKWAELHLANSRDLRIKTADECAKELLKIREPETLKCFFALWSLATQQDSAEFKDVPLSQLMKLVLKEENPNKRDRQRFTKALHWIEDMSISVRQIQEDPPSKGKRGKSKMVLREIRNIRLFYMTVTYSVREQYKHLPKEQLREEHFDQSVIAKFSGRLLPTNPELFAESANIYMNSLLRLDANKGGRAVIVGFAIQTRFNQKQNKRDAVKMSRSQLIELCEYEKTNARQASTATNQLAKVFDTLIAAGIISRYEGLTNVDTDQVSFYPPTPAALPAG